MSQPTGVKATPPRTDRPSMVVGGPNSFPGLEAEQANARKHGRLKCELVSSTLGEVVDISGSGMRVRSPGKPPIRTGQQFDLTVSGLGEQIHLPVKCVWIRRIGLFKREIGLAYGELPDETRSRLSKLAHLAAVKTVVTPT